MKNFSTNILLLTFLIFQLKAQSVCKIEDNNFITDYNFTDTLTGYGSLGHANGLVAQNTLEFPISSLLSFNLSQFGHDSIYSEFYKNFYSPASYHHVPYTYRFINTTYLEQIVYNSNWSVYPINSYVNVRHPLDYIESDSFPVYIPKFGNDYITYSMFNSTFKSFYYESEILLNGDTSHVKTINTSFENKNIINKTYVLPNTNCNNLLFPECNTYNFSFYIRPTPTFNFMFEVPTNPLNIPNHFFVKKDIYYIDSLLLVTYNIDGSIIDTFTITKSNALRDSSQWHLISFDFQVPDTTNLLAIIPAFNQDSLIYNYESNFDYKAYLDSLEQYMPGRAYEFDFSVFYSFDSIALAPIGYENLDLCLTDTSFCESFSINVDAYQPEFTRYEWSTGDTTSSINIDSAGTYTLSAYYPCGVLCDEFTVFEEPANYLLPLSYADTLTICEQNLPITLNAADTFATYLWSNGDTTFSSTFNQEGMIYLETQHFCGTLRDSVYLNVIETEILNINDTTICANQNIITINVNPNFDTYLWSNGDTTASSSFDTAGIYWIQAFYLCDTLTDTFQVFEEPTLILNYADTLEFCTTDLPIILHAADTFQNYSWSNGDTTFSTSVNQEGMVYLETQHFCGTLRDSVYLKLKDKETLNLIPFTDTLICTSDLPFTLQINDTLQNYVWSNGATTFQNTFIAAGTYFVSADNGCHNYTDTFNLQTENLATGNFKHQNIYCPEDFPITLTAPSALNPNWNTGENANSITVNNAVNDVYIHNSFSQVCGNRTDSFFVYVLPDTISQLPQILIDDFCLEEGFYQFSTIVKDTNFVYQWENQTSLNFTTKGGATQTLSISNACLSLEIDTFIERCPEQIAFALPTAFSPNNDGVNDIFQLLYLNPNYQFENLKIYNRWGELIFNSTDKTIGWNGIYKNQNAAIGNYIYHLELQNENLEIEIFKGNLSLIR